MKYINYVLLSFAVCVSTTTRSQTSSSLKISASEIIGNSEYQAISYGGYREKTRETVPTVAEIKEDMKILAALDVKLLRTYNTQQFAHAARILEAISELKSEDPNFEMYVMLGAWIECEGAWTANTNHSKENESNNAAEIEAAVKLANQYPDIVKVIAVGNEAMVHWAASYFVTPDIVLRWVNHLQELKSNKKLPSTIWITSSDNFASWGGGDASYHVKDLELLIQAVDFVSMHTYPFHDSHYNPAYWGVPEEEESLNDVQIAEMAVFRAGKYAQKQYQSTVDYIKSLGIEKPIHIGETGWASIAGELYGATGSQAADEYKAKLYYDYIREWTTSENITCFFFEAFDEQWKDPNSADGSENHFGLITLDGEAKYALWDEVDKDTFKGLTRNGKSITKTYNGDVDALMRDVLVPPKAGTYNTNK